MTLLEILNSNQLTKADKLILIYLNKIEKKRICNVSYTKISKDICTSKQTIITSIKKLEDKKLIDIENVLDENNGNLTNIYKITGGYIND